VRINDIQTRWQRQRRAADARCTVKISA